MSIQPEVPPAPSPPNHHSSSSLAQEVVLQVFKKASRILDHLDEAELRQKINEDPVLLLRFLTVLARLCECATRLDRVSGATPSGTDPGLPPGASDESIAIVERAMGLL